MKNQQQGIVWAPVLIMIGVVLVTGVAAYFLFQAGQSNNENTNVTVVNQTNENVNTSTTANTNQAITNSEVNANTSQATRTKQQFLNTQRIFFATHKAGSNEEAKTLQTIKLDGTESLSETTPSGYKRLTSDGYRLSWVIKNGKISLWDRANNKIYTTSLPDPLQGDTIYEEVSPLVYSNDLSYVLMEYAKYDKNSEAYKNEFAGPMSVSSRYFEYSFENDVTSPAPKGLNTFYDVWDRTNNYLYTHRSGEGIGNATPVTRLSTTDGSKILSPDYGNNSGPAFSSDGSHMAIPVPEKSPLQIHIFDLPNISTPSKTLTLKDVKDARPENVLGYIYNLAWFNNDTQLVLSFSHSGYVIDVATGQATKFFEQAAINPQTSNLQWDWYPAFPSQGSVFIFQTSIKYPVPKDNVSMKVMFNAYDTKTKTLKKITCMR